MPSLSGRSPRKQTLDAKGVVAAPTNHALLGIEKELNDIFADDERDDALWKDADRNANGTLSFRELNAFISTRFPALHHRRCLMDSFLWATQNFGKDKRHIGRTDFEPLLVKLLHYCLHVLII